MNSTSWSRRDVILAGMSALASGACAGAPRSASSAPSADSDPARFARAQMQQYRIPGLALAVQRRGRVAAAYHAGANDLELGVPVRADTPFQLASVSKIFTSVGVMLLADGGKLRLDTPVTELLPDAPSTWSAIRVHHLLSHTSGLPGNIAANPGYAAEERTRRDRSRFVDEAKLDYFTTRERLAYLADLPLQAAPGARWSYNQPGYVMLGAIVEQLTGRPFATYMRERIFAPLGMTTAAYGDSRVVVPGRRQVAYTRQFGPLQNWIWPYATSDYPAAGLNASADDVAKLFVALEQGLLRSETRDAMWAEVTPADGRRSHYALGWTVESVGGRTIVGHEGGGCAWASHVPAERTTAIVLTNLAGSGADLGNKLAGLYL